MNNTLGRLLKLVIPVKGWMALATLLGFLTVAAGVGLMSTSAYMISYAALHPDVGALGVAIVGVRFFGISRGIFRYLERYVTHEVTFRLLARLRVWFYSALEPLAPARLLEFRTGDLLTRIVGDIETLQNFYGRVIAPPLVAAVTALIMWFFLGAFDPLFALTLIFYYLLASIAVPFLAYLLGRKFGEETITARSELNSALVDSLQGMAELVAFRQEKRQEARLAGLNKRLVRLQLWSARLNGLQSTLTGLLMNLAIWTMLLVAIPLVREGKLDGLYLALLALAAAASFEAVLPLPVAFQQLGGSLAAARRLFEIVDAPPAVADPAIPASLPSNFDLEFKDTTFRYKPDETPVLKNINLKVAQGRCLAVLGESGAGKSTLGSLLLRFWDPQQGQIKLGGTDLRQLALADLHRLIGVVAQDTHLFNTTIRQNIMLACPEATEEDLFRVAQQAQIHDFILSLPEGYETWVGENGLRLSGGERQRLAIARALLKDAPILLLDEATANLDSLAEREVMQAIQSLRQGRTTLIITHHLTGLEQADEIIVLSEGRIVEQGSPLELQSGNSRYFRHYAQPA